MLASKASMAESWWPLSTWLLQRDLSHGSQTWHTDREQKGHSLCELPTMSQALATDSSKEGPQDVMRIVTGSA